MNPVLSFALLVAGLRAGRASAAGGEPVPALASGALAAGLVGIVALAALVGVVLSCAVLGVALVLLV